jgi:hypothetical protein
MLFGIIVLAATGFYWQTFPSCLNGKTSCVLSARSEPVNFSTSGLAPLLPFQNHWVGVYWLTMIPVGFFLSIWFFRHQRSMTGIKARVVPAAIVSVAILALIVARSTLIGWPLLFLPGDLTVRGLIALLVIGAGLALFALLERSVELVVFTGLFFGLALVACLYDISNVANFSSSPSAAELPNIVLPGAFLLLGGIAFGVLDLRKSVE